MDLKSSKSETLPDYIKDLIISKLFKGDITGNFEYNDVRELSNEICVKIYQAKCEAWDEAWKAFMKSNPKNPYR